MLGIPDSQALIRTRLGGISCYGEKMQVGRSEILKIQLILKSLIPTKTRGRPNDENPNLPPQALHGEG